MYTYFISRYKIKVENCSNKTVIYMYILHKVYKRIVMLENIRSNLAECSSLNLATSTKV
jgi:hypothetical protein